MLSLDKGGHKIAKIKRAKKKDQYIYLNDEIGSYDMSKLPKSFFNKYKDIDNHDKMILKRSLKEHNPPKNEKLISIYVDAINYLRKDTNEIRLTSGKIQPLPRRDIVEKIYISAPSGAGKSTFCGKWLCEFIKMFKDDEIYIFSSVGKDKVLDKYDPIRIPIDVNLLNEPIQPEEVRDSCCIFDDIDTITDARLKRNVCGLRDLLLEIGRHYNTRMLSTSHLLMNYSSTRRLLNEATAVVFFPRSGSAYHIKRFLKQYAGLESNQIKRILNLPSRWVAIYRTYPMMIMYEKGVYLLSSED